MNMNIKDVAGNINIDHYHNSRNMIELINALKYTTIIIMFKSIIVIIMYTSSWTSR